MTFGEVALVGGEGGLIRDFDSGRVSALRCRLMHVVRIVEGGLLERAQGLGGDVYLAGRAGVLAGLGDGDRLFAQAHGEFTGDTGVEVAHGELYDFLGGFWHADSHC